MEDEANQIQSSWAEPTAQNVPMTSGRRNYAQYERGQQEGGHEHKKKNTNHDRCRYGGNAREKGKDGLYQSYMVAEKWNRTPVQKRKIKGLAKAERLRMEQSKKQLQLRYSTTTTQFELALTLRNKLKNQSRHAA